MYERFRSIRGVRTQSRAVSLTTAVCGVDSDVAAMDFMICVMYAFMYVQTYMYVVLPADHHATEEIVFTANFLSLA